MSSESQSNASLEEGSNKSLEQGGCFAAGAKDVPFRMQQVLISWVFIVASAALMLNFGALQDVVRGRTDWFAELVNWFGTVSCVAWLLGFILLSHWLHQVGATPMGKMGAYLKLIASIFFNLQPMTGTMNDSMLGGTSGLWWSNLTGIVFFHVGNLVSCLDFYLHTTPGADTKKGWCFHGNLPVTGMWVYQAATWFLVAGNVMATHAPGSSSLLPTSSAPVLICQFAGSGLLLVGSLVYLTWCDGWSNFNH